MKLGLDLLSATLNAGAAMTVLSYALRAGHEDFRFLARERRLMGLSLISIFVVVPAIALAVIEWIEMPAAARLAIVSLSFSIVPTSLPRSQFVAGGRRPYANTLTLTVAILAIPVVPLLVDLTGRGSNHSYGVPAGEIAGYVFTVLVVPLIVGLLLRRRWPETTRRVAHPLNWCALGVTSVAVSIEVALSLPAIWSLLGGGTVLGMALFSIGAMGAGHLMGGPDHGDELVLALSSATRHPAVALTIASANFPEQRVSHALMLCLMINGVMSFAYVGWQRLRPRPLVASAREPVKGL